MAVALDPASPLPPRQLLIARLQMDLEKKSQSSNPDCMAVANAAIRHAEDLEAGVPNLAPTFTTINGCVIGSREMLTMRPGVCSFVIACDHCLVFTHDMTGVIARQASGWTGSASMPSSTSRRRPR